MHKRHATIGACIGLVVAICIFALLIGHWWVFIVFPCAGAALGNAIGARSSANGELAKSALSPLQQTLLTLGYLLGPFFLATLVCLGLAAAGWPKLGFQSWLVIGIPVAAGCVCLWLRHRPMGWKIFLLIPYAALYSLATAMFAIVPAMMLGAPK